MTKAERVELFEKFGFNPIHICGNFYLARNKSRKYCNFSFYKIIFIKN